MNLLPHPQQTNSQKLARLCLLFALIVGFHTLLITPFLTWAFKADADQISLLQNQSGVWAKKAGTDVYEIQKTVIEGAKNIKSSLSSNLYYYLYVTQMSFNVLCFLLVGILFRHFAFTKEQKSADWVKVRPMLYAMSPALLISALPLIGESMLLNDWLGINYLLKKMGTDTSAESIANMIFSYAVFLPENNWEVFSSIVFVAIIPAIGEELLFRGSLQKILTQLTGNVHWAILITSIIFSAFHFEITAFFYRFFLGVMLGYTYLWGRTLVIPIIIHASNNLLTVIYMFYSFKGVKQSASTNDTMEQNPALSILLSSLMAISILVLFYADYRRNTEPKSENEMDLF